MNNFKTPQTIALDIFDGKKITPKNIYYKGPTQWLTRPLVSVVGAREVKPWVLEWMENELGPALANLEVGVVSGGARGVDQMAHSLAIRAGLPNIVVLPSGMGRAYPRSIQGWVGQSSSLFLSEYEDTQEMRKFHFYCRNKIVISLSPLTLVIQAKERSGTMMSSKFAVDGGKTLATLPANPMDSAFSGNNQLLFDGSQMIRNRQDIEALLSTHVIC